MNGLLQLHGPDTLVAFAGSGSRTRRQLEACADAISGKLHHTSTSQCVVLACSDRYLFAAGLLAAWSRGLRVALPSNGQDETVHRLARKIDAVALLHDRDQALGIDVRPLEADAVASCMPLHLRLERQEIAVTAFTSGSTGEPQAHHKSLAQLVDEAQLLTQHFELTGCRVLAAVPSHHIYGLLFGVLVPLCAGGAMSRSSPLLPADLLASAEHDHADVLVAVPPHLRSLSQADAWTRNPFRRVFCSGGPLALEVASALASRGMVVTQVLGSTETGGVAYRESFADPWQPLPGVSVSADARGAMLVTSPWFSADITEPVPTATQDRIALVPGGFQHLGRLDAVVKVGGRRVDLGELETTLRTLPGVRDARVLAELGDAVRGSTLLAVVEADAITPEQLRRHLTLSVDPVVVPRRIRIVSALPRNAAGKVTRAALLALFDTWTFPCSADADDRLQVRVPASLGFFRGHFPSDPILPGVVQLHYLALAQARTRWPELGAVVRVTRVKFKRPIVPGEALVLALARKRSELVEFSLSCGEQVASSGLLHFERPLGSGGSDD